MLCFSKSFPILIFASIDSEHGCSNAPLLKTENCNKIYMCIYNKTNYNMQVLQ